MDQSAIISNQKIKNNKKNIKKHQKNNKKKHQKNNKKNIKKHQKNNKKKHQKNNKKKHQKNNKKNIKKTTKRRFFYSFSFFHQSISMYYHRRVSNEDILRVINSYLKLS